MAAAPGAATRLPSTIASHNARIVDRRRMVAISQGKVIHNFTHSLQEFTERMSAKKNPAHTRIDMYPTASLAQSLWFPDEDEVVFMRRTINADRSVPGNKKYRQTIFPTSNLQTQDNLPYSFSLFNGLQLKVDSYPGLTAEILNSFSADRQSFYALRDFDVVCISRAQGLQGAANRDGTLGTGQTAFAGQTGGTHSITWYSDEIGYAGAWVRVALPPMGKENEYVPMGAPGRDSYECEGRTDRRTAILKVFNPLEISSQVMKLLGELDTPAKRLVGLRNAVLDRRCNVFTFERLAFFMYLRGHVAEFHGGADFPLDANALGILILGNTFGAGAFDANNADTLVIEAYEGLQHVLHRHTLGKLIQFCRPGEKTDIYIGKSRTISG